MYVLCRNLEIFANTDIVLTLSKLKHDVIHDVGGDDI